MVAGLKFLSKKGFNPQNFSNRKRVWEREQASQNEERRVKERNEELRRERDDEELTRSRGDSLKVNFLYAVPPGLETAAAPGTTAAAAASKKEPSADFGDVSLTLRQPGDDDAAAAFRAMLAEAEHSIKDNKSDEKQHNKTLVRGTAPGSFGTVLQGSTYDKFAEFAAAADQQQSQDRKPPQDRASSALEKAVGRRQQGGSLTLAEQIERFPALANAPRQRGVAVGVTFRPLGTQIRNVRCMKCGVWGHSKGDRECKVGGWNPFDLRSSTCTNVNNSTRNDADVDRDEEVERGRKERKKKDRKKETKRKRRYEDRESGDKKERKTKRKKSD
jgi:CBF1 interacting corepressor